MAADIQTSLKNWSTNEASNAPSGTTAISSNLDDNIRMLQTVVRQDLAHKGQDISAASTMDIGAVAGSYHDVTGSTTVTGLGTVSAGIWKILQFDSTPQLTHNATALGLPTSANITAESGDHLLAVSLGSGNWAVPFYQRKSGLPVNGNFPDSFFRVVGSSDATKKLAFEVDGFTTGNTRTVTFPDANLSFPAVATKGDIFVGSAASVMTAVGVGTEGQILAAEATEASGVIWRDKIASSLTSTGSGTSASITSVPSYAKRITITLQGVSLNGATELILRLGDTGGLENSGYTGVNARMGSSGGVYSGNSTSFILTESAQAGNVYDGVITLIRHNESTNCWVVSSTVTTQGANNMNICSGTKELSSALTQVSILSANGSSAFDAGSIGFQVE